MSTTKHHRKKQELLTRRNIVLVLFVCLVAGLGVYSLIRSRAATNEAAMGPQTNQTFLTYTGNGYTSRYHLYAANLDWSKPVGMLIYADGSGEYGLNNPTGSYLLAGTKGLIATAKKHNMLLLTPFSPNTNCPDTNSACWYYGDSPGYTKWAEALVRHVQSQYPVDLDRIAFGGYSSGAQLATEFWVPSGAAQHTMTKGVIVAISYGGSPKMAQTAYTSDFKANVHLNWNTGDKDEAYTTPGAYGVKAGYKHYTDAGFKTSLDVIPGVGHSRSGDFGSIMDAQIVKHVRPSTSKTPGMAIEAESGLLNQEALKTNDPTASGGQAVQFGRGTANP